MQSIAPETLLSLQRDPAGLEATYRAHPVAFTRALSVALDQSPDSLALQIWAARLDVALADTTDGPAPPVWTWASALTPERVRMLLWTVAGLILAAGTWAKLPDLLGWTRGSFESADGLTNGYQRAEDFYARFVPFIAVLPLVALFAARYRPPVRLLATVGGIALALLAIQALRPVDTDAGMLASIHAPLLLLSLGGVLTMGTRWREVAARIGYLQLVSESLAFAALLALGGLILLGITAALFGAIGVEVSTVLFEWVAVYGIIGVLPVGALVASQRAESGRVAPLVARVFGPLALVVLAVYLPVLLATGGLADRDSLLALNVTLVAVLALVILMQAERPDVRRHWTDGVAFALVALTLLADLAALASIADRLAGGLTPNRLAVVGMNALIAVHFVGLVLPLGRRALRGDWPGDGWTARFLSVYAAWSALVVLVFPFLFA